MDSFKIPNFSLGLLSFCVLLYIYNSNKNIFFENSIDLSQQIIDNNNFSLIYNIEVIDKDNNCSNDYSPLIIYHFNGFDEGCLINNNSLKKGKCNYINNFFNQCENIDKIEKKDFKNIFGKTICIKTNKLDLNDSFIKKSCDKINEIDCGYFDIEKNKLCIQKGNQCPINEIIFDNNQNSYLNTIKINNNLFLHFSNNNPEGNIKFSNNFFINEGDLCLNKYEYNTFHEPYILDNIYNNYTCRTHIKLSNVSNFSNYFDLRFSSFLSFNKNDFFIENNLNISNLNHFPFPDTELKLYSVLYIPDKIYISNNIIHLKFCSLMETINIILFRVSLILILITQIIKFYKRYIPDKTTIIFFLIYNILLIFSFVISILSYFTIKKILSFSTNSYDYNIEKEIYYITEFMKETQNIYYIDIIGLSFIIILQIILFIYNYYKTKNKKKKNLIVEYDNETDIIELNSSDIIFDSKNSSLIIKDY